MVHTYGNAPGAENVCEKDAGVPMPDEKPGP